MPFRHFPQFLFLPMFFLISAILSAFFCHLISMFAATNVRPGAIRVKI